MLHSLPESVAVLLQSDLDIPTYWYQDRDPSVGNPQRLPRTTAAEALGQYLMEALEQEQAALLSRDGHGPGPGNSLGQEGKMYGVLIVETSGGERGWLKAFSGLLEGSAERPGWVPTIPGRDRVALLEAQTLSELEALKLELMTLKCLPQREQLNRQRQDFELQFQQLRERHRQNKAQRQAQRQAISADLCEEERNNQLRALEEASRRDGRERRVLKQARDQALGPWVEAVAQADEQMRNLKRRRKKLSQQLQTEMHRAYSLQNFAGAAVSLNDLGLNSGIGPLPTGTGECCMPKLLHYAASQRLKPLALAEFWWGPALGDRQPGQFYGACEERCQPLMGFLLSGLERFVQASKVPPPTEDLGLTVLYEDAWIIAIDKPAGLLSVPGRSRQNQDSVLSRLRNQLQDDAGQLLGDRLQAVHRLDQDTSGILLLAKDGESQRSLQHQFQQQQIFKNYEALLQGQLMLKGGRVDLPLAPDPEHRPRQRVDPEHGKPCLTRFFVLERCAGLTRVRFEPATGRTHQLRIHAKEGLGLAIVGDRLYGEKAGSSPSGSRLCLHSKEISFCHPHTQERLRLRSPVPF